MNGHTPHEEFLSNIDGRESRWSGSTSNVFFDSYQTYSMQGGDYLDYILPQLDTMLCPIQVAQVNLPDTPQPPLDIWLQNPQTRGASPNSVPSQIRIQVAQHNLPGPPHPLLEIWQQTPPMQVDASPDYISSWIDMSQIQATQENPPQPSQPSFEIPQRTSPAYQASSLDYALSQMDISTPPENQVNQPMSSQPPSEIRNQTYSVPGDANLDHVPSCQIAKSSAPTPSQPHLCPICGRYFERRQERDRHVFSYLPHWIYCPLLDCPWRGNRRYDFKKHWEKFHSDHGEVPEAQKSQIYDADALVKLIVDRHLTINEAAQTIALPEVERRAHELGKKDIWGADRWGRRMRNFE